MSNIFLSNPYKIVILGKQSIGKTTFINQILNYYECENKYISNEYSIYNILLDDIPISIYEFNNNYVENVYYIFNNENPYNVLYIILHSMRDDDLSNISRYKKIVKRINRNSEIMIVGNSINKIGDTLLNHIKYNILKTYNGISRNFKLFYGDFVCDDFPNPIKDILKHIKYVYKDTFIEDVNYIFDINTIIDIIINMFDRVVKLECIISKEDLCCILSDYDFELNELLLFLENAEYIIPYKDEYIFTLNLPSSIKPNYYFYKKIINGRLRSNFEVMKLHSQYINIDKCSKYESYYVINDIHIEISINCENCEKYIYIKYKYYNNTIEKFIKKIESF
uniref:Uncharacterized protein n=1 Tax=Pithovirus LCDPAC02 TaxID=2506601 RepID=A0A481YPQ7_9VIRU|nr:MAG: hypothetical protein LCDPAC02_01260 [Pithovirus LCDPAC02]